MPAAFHSLFTLYETSSFWGSKPYPSKILCFAVEGNGKILLSVHYREL